METQAKVFVNEQPRPYFPGITVKFAIGPDNTRKVEQGLLKVTDQWGHQVGLGGSLQPGERIYIKGY